jgi:hypothetical protein
MTSDVDWDQKLYDNDIVSFEDFHDPTFDAVDHITLSMSVGSIVTVRLLRTTWLRKKNILIQLSTMILTILWMILWIQ